MTKLKITHEKYMGLPVWVSYWVFTEISGASSQQLKATIDRLLKEMYSHGFVNFDKIEISDTWRAHYVITFDTEENMAKFIMEYL